MKKITIHNKSNLKTCDYKKFKDLQGDLKTITPEDLENLKGSIVEFGFAFPFFVWVDRDGTFWIQDGHQRTKALDSLEKDGFEIQEVPYVEIEAKNKKRAAELLLHLNSKYGKFNLETTFFDDFGIDIGDLDNIEIPELEEMTIKDFSYDFQENEEDKGFEENKTIRPKCGFEF